MKKIITIGTAGIFVLLMYFYPHEMISPGDLVEGHDDLNAKCFSCHEPFKGIASNKCIVCHALADIGKDKMQRMDSAATTDKSTFHLALANEKCTTCHTDHKGLKPDVPLSTFTHEILPEAERVKCNSCHALPADKIHQHLPPDCKACHSTDGWKLAVSFNHDMIQGMDKTNCVSCHEAPSDEFHQQTTESCSACHTTSAWVPSTFDHEKYFRLDRNHPDKCKSCHLSNNYAAYTCYGCHEHTEANMLQEHREEGIYNITDCARCHKSGNEDDVIRGIESNKRLDEQQINNVKDYIDSKEKKGEYSEDSEKDED